MWRFSPWAAVTLMFVVWVMTALFWMVIVVGIALHHL
jgi:hypothetical protein